MVVENNAMDDDADADADADNGWLDAIKIMTNIDILMQRSVDEIICSHNMDMGSFLLTLRRTSCINRCDAMVDND